MVIIRLGFVKIKVQSRSKNFFLFDIHWSTTQFFYICLIFQQVTLNVPKGLIQTVQILVRAKMSCKSNEMREQVVKVREK